MNDYIVGATAANATVRAYASVTTQMVEKARVIHELFPVPCVALGRTMTAAALMAKTLKGNKDSITIQIKGDGPIGSHVVISNSTTEIRGYVDNSFFDIPLNEKGKFDIKGAVGNGYLNIIKDMGLKEPYIGKVDLVSGEIAEDITYYYATSEQVPTVTVLGVLIDKDFKVKNAGGLLIQLMPDCEPETIDLIEKNIVSLPPITSAYEEGMTPEDYLEMALKGTEIRYFDRSEPVFKCTCSRERMLKNMIS